MKSLLESLLGGPLLNLATENEHVPDIERQIRVVKEWCRATNHYLTFQSILKLLTTHTVFNTVKMLNFFPTKGGISESLNPKTIISGDILDFKNNLHIQLGQYYQVHEDESPHDSQAPITKGVICLGTDILKKVVVAKHKCVRTRQSLA